MSCNFKWPIERMHCRYIGLPPPPPQKKIVIIIINCFCQVHHATCYGLCHLNPYWVVFYLACLQSPASVSTSGKKQRYGRAISLFSIPLFRASVISDYYPIKVFDMFLSNFGTKIAGSVLFPKIKHQFRHEMYM